MDHVGEQNEVHAAVGQLRPFQGSDVTAHGSDVPESFLGEGSSMTLDLLGDGAAEVVHMDH